MQDQLRELIRKHCATLAQRVQGLGEVIGNLTTEMKDADATLREGREIAHQITGASGSMGFPPVSAAAQTLERHLEAVMETGEPLTAAQVAQAGALFGELHNATQSAVPESSTIYNADLSQLRPGAGGPR